MELLLPLILSGMGVAVAAVAFANREKPDWQGSVPALMVLAVTQVALGVVAWLVVGR